MLSVNLLRKRCSKCKIEKSITLGFRIRKSGTGAGTPASWCIKCTDESAKKWQAAHPEKKASTRVRYVRSLRQGVLDKFGGKCSWCGFSDPRALQVDHVHNDGHLDEAKWRKARTTFFKRVLGDTEGRFQLLCANCNTIKAYEHNLSRRQGKVA